MDDHPEPEVPANPTRAFLRTGYGECLDSFFAFGLFRMGERAQYFPPALVSIFETIMQEEARHILFIVNWAAYLRARRPWVARPAFDAWRAWNIVAQAIGRLKGALEMAGGGKGEPKSKPEASEAVSPSVDNSTGRVHHGRGLDLRRLLDSDVPRAVPRRERPAPGSLRCPPAPADDGSLRDPAGRQGPSAPAALGLGELEGKGRLSAGASRSG